MRDPNALINKKVKKITQVTGSKGTRQATKFAPQSPRQAKKEKQIMASEKRRARVNKINRVAQGIITGGGSEIARRLVKGDAITIDTRKIVPSVKRAFDKLKKVNSTINNKVFRNAKYLTTGFNKKSSSFKMKGFSGFKSESPVRKGKDGIPHTGYGKKFDPAKHVVDFKKGVAYTPKGKVKVNVDKISKKPANAFQKARANARAAQSVNARNLKATGKIGRKVATKLGSRLLGPVGVGLAIKDAIGTYKDIKRGMKPGKAARKNFLGF
tara:strand:+ start:282 stop:1088 length:807 start_codon:yes stop_codon:yes gene_type:complete